MQISLALPAPPGHNSPISARRRAGASAARRARRAGPPARAEGRRARAEPAAAPGNIYMNQPLVGLYGGCMEVLKVS